jgi:RNA polymerase sigma-70 factor (ECF subfamily)
MELSEHDLETIRKAMGGDQAAFELLVDRFARLVYAQSFSLLHDHGEAQDVVQECFLKAYRFRVRLAQVERFPQWLLAIARNLARDRLRRRDRTDGRGRPEPDLGNLPDERRSPLGILQVLDDLAQLQSLLGALPQRSRQALVLRYVAGLGHRDIQSRLGLSAGALRGVLGRGLLTLRRRMR